LPANQEADAKNIPARALAGRKIVVTRAAEQARELTARLTELGATVILLPVISFADPADFSPLDAAIAALGGFDWVLFTSANAARFFARRCRTRGIEPRAAQSGERSLFVATVGPATSEAAAAEGFLVGHMAEEFQGSALARELAEDLAGRRVLLPRGDLAAADLPTALRAAGADVTEVICYRTLEVDSAAPEAVEAVRRGDVDVVSFFSASAFRALVGHLGTEYLRRVAIAAIGPVTAAEIRAAGLTVAIEAPEATTKSLISALIGYLPVGSLRARSISEQGPPGENSP
jgi:uroporphyrinogen III methyltransferase/synthase